MHRGYVKFWRKILEWEWFTSSETFHVFAFLFLSANHSDENYKGFPVKRGQILTGRKSISEKTGVSERSIRTALTRLKATGEITIKTTNKHSIITLCNYDIYNCPYEQNDQQDDQQAVTPATSNRPATDQQPTTNKNVKNVNNEKNVKNISILPLDEREERFKQEVNSFAEYDQKLRDDFIRHWTEKSKNGKKMKFEMNRTFEIKKRLITWKNNNEKWFGNQQTQRKLNEYEIGAASKYENL